MEWHVLRKTTTHVHLSDEYSDATLFAENIGIRAGDPFDVSVDLNKSLRTRYKSVRTHQDARDLGGGTVRTLKSDAPGRGGQAHRRERQNQEG